MASFAQHITEDRSENLYLVRGGRDHTDQAAWYFIQVEQTKRQAFLRAIAAGEIELDIFGEIIESGYGEEPPAAILSHMRANYNFAG